ncbi:hypothetical protein FQN55_003688 [Onygenales sp. PD_40]|nr:hypothetical protein FQN55_003688 [Onygenales sp. PD_40]KAK2781738.1 hypothetical protein FQN53_000422 [Emmonsiellopsis sp. PD_33]KAK2798370.1 hypothetical protein FQN51_007770 [Onygenales sp. PD_10]
MAGGHMKYRHLGRDSAHRKALLRNLVTSLFEHEAITTTWPKAKEAQRMADKLITLGKKNTVASRQSAQAVFFKPELMQKLFGPIRDRYLTRPGGYTRVLRVEPKKDDQAPSAILQLVDGPRDVRFAMTARTLARQRALGNAGLNQITALNVKKVTRYRKDGEKELEREVERIAREGRKKGEGEEEID